MRFVFGLLALCLVATTSAQTTGMVRGRFIENADKSCFDKQRAERPKSVPDTAVKTFCTCNSRYLADHVTNDDVMAIRNSGKALDPKLITTANQSCESQIATH